MEDNTTPSTITKFPHHIRSELCTSRPPYRQGKKLTAVKVYTVNEESQHLLIRGVPVLNLQKELKHLCMRYGEVKYVSNVCNYSEDEEAFTEVYHVLFSRIQSARFAKHMMDDRAFYGGILHVFYAPELESIPETKHKLLQRKHDVLKRIKPASQINQMLSNQSYTSEISFAAVSTNSYAQSHIKMNFKRAGVVEQKFIPRKREVSSKSCKKSFPVPSTSTQSESSTRQSKSIQTPSQRRSAPDKFIPTPLKRIRFNKIK